MFAKLKRHPQNGKQTTGEFTLYKNGSKVLELKTVELKWDGNKKRISCIPVGKYKCVPRTSTKYKRHFHITNVPGRDFILIHPANYSRELLGCIGVGLTHTDIDKDGLLDVTNSKVAMEKLITFTDWKEFELEIYE